MELVEGVADVDSVDAFVAELSDVGERHGVAVQAFDARYVVGRDHLARAVELADRERARGDAIARERAVEILLYAAGRRQIDRALELGVGTGETPVVVVVAADPGAADGESAEGAAADAVAALLDPAETLGAYDPDRVRSFFDVGDDELAATGADLADLVLERVALLVVER